MSIEKFNPVSPDLAIINAKDATIAKFGHLNQIVNYINSGCAGGGLSYFTANCQIVCGRTSSVLLSCGNTNTIDTVISAKNNGRIVFSSNNSFNTCSNFIDTNLGQTVLGGSTICSTYTGVGRSTVVGWANTLKCGNCNVIFGFRNTICSTFDSRRFNGIFGTDNILDNVGERNHMYGLANTLCGTINSHTFGSQNIGTSSNYASLIGCGNTTSSASNSINIGHNNVLSGVCSYAFGKSNTVSGIGSVALGISNITSGNFSAVFGGSNNISCLPYSGVYGCGITSSMSCAFHTNRLVVTQLPNSSAGLPSGALWYDPADGNRVKYVP